MQNGQSGNYTFVFSRCSGSIKSHYLFNVMGQKINTSGSPALLTTSKKPVVFEMPGMGNEVNIPTEALSPSSCRIPPSWVFINSETLGIY